MLVRLKTACIALAAVVATYYSYAVAVVPFIEPRAAGPAAGRASEDEIALARQLAGRRTRDRLEGIFPDGSWEIQDPKVLESDRVMVLLRDYRVLDDGRVEVKPCTFVFFPQGRATRSAADSPQRAAAGTLARPIVLQAPEGAVLEFDEPIDLRRAKIGRLVGGLLVGPIRIHSRESSPGAGDSLEIATRNIQINPRQIWTPHEVQFRHGRSHGTGRDLQIAFEQAEGDIDSRRSGLIDGRLKSLELVHVDKFHVEMAGLLPGASTPPPESPQPPIEITCRGSFVFDFIDHVASFEDQVDVWRLQANGPSDQLTCRLLEIYLRSERADTDDTQDSTAPGIARLVASGSPVQVRAPSMGAALRGERLDYDFAAAVVRLEGAGGAWLRRNETEIEARGLEAHLTRDGGLGRLWALGPGRFRGPHGGDSAPESSPNALTGPGAATTGAMPAERDPQWVEAEWRKELLFRPHDGHHVLSLTDLARIEVPGKGRIAAGQIHFWLKEAARNVSAATLPSNGIAGIATPRDRSPQLVPDKLLAIDKVEVLSTQLTARAERLEAWFGQASVHADGTRNALTENLAMSGFRRQPALANGPNSNDGANFTRLDAAGEVIRVRLAGSTSLFEPLAVEELAINGKVRLAEVAEGQAAAPLVITGDSLQIERASGPDTLVTVKGSMAVVQARGLGLSGATVRLDKAANRLWIDGPGDLRLPSGGVLPGGDSRGDSSLAVAWQGGMNFDGRNLICRERVEVRGETQVARAESLEAALSTAIDFSRPSASSDAALKDVSLHGDVFLENRTYDALGLESIERMQVRGLRVDHASGALWGGGPGWATTIRRGMPNQLAGGTGSGPNAIGSQRPPLPWIGRTRPPNDASAGQGASHRLSFLNVTFQQGLAGNIHKREMQFLTQVKGVCGPVTDWDQSLSLDRLDALPEEAVLMTCDRLAVVEMAVPGRAEQRSVELEALGNTLVEGKTFTARAHRLSYAQAKDLIVLEGNGRSDAEIWRQQRVGGPASRAMARKILYWRANDRIEVDDAKYLDLTHLGGG
jgi:hypothetical protein